MSNWQTVFEKISIAIVVFVISYACSKGSSELVHESAAYDSFPVGGDLASDGTTIIEEDPSQDSADAFASVQLKRNSNEEVIHSKSFHINGRMVSKSKFNLVSEEFLTVTGTIKLPEVLSGRETPVGCLTINVHDTVNTDLKSWVRLSTTGIRGEVLNKVTVPLLIGLENKVEVPIFPDSLTIEHFPSNTVKVYEREVCFFLKEVETPAQAYEGEILIQYLQETKEILASTKPQPEAPEEPEEPEPEEPTDDDSGTGGEGDAGSDSPSDDDSGGESDGGRDPDSDPNGDDDPGEASGDGDGDSYGSDNGGEQIPDEVLEELKGNLSKEDVVYLCQNFQTEQIDQDLFFPEREDCSWGTKHKRHADPYANLRKRNHYLQAREFQTHTLDIPKYAVLCELEVSSHTDDNIQYDDFLVFTLNDYILMLSNHFLLREMPVKNDFYFWDFAEIKGKYYEFHGDRFCFDGYKSCEFPGHDIPGPVDFFLDTSSLSPLASILEKEETLSLKVIATGDNDRYDCWHTDIYLNIKSQYVDFRALFKDNS